MKKSHMVIFALTFILVFIVGLLVGTSFFSRTKVLGEQELQDYIDEVTFEHIKLFEDEGFKVNQSHIIGILWIQCEKLGTFLLMARYVLKVDTIYLHWKIDFLRQPVFYVLVNKTAIIYEPF